MSLTVYDQSKFLYDTYTYNNSNTNKATQVDPSAVSKTDYNVSNITNALDSLSKTDTADFAAIGNVDSFVQNAYMQSQLTVSEKYGSSGDSTITRLLTGDAGANDIYKLIDYSNELVADKVQSAVSDPSESSQYGTYLNKTGNILDTLA